MEQLHDFFVIKLGRHGLEDFKQWLESESALAKCKSAEEELILKTCCLMGLGSSGQRSRVSYENLLTPHHTMMKVFSKKQSETC